MTAKDRPQKREANTAEGDPRFRSVVGAFAKESTSQPRETEGLRFGPQGEWQDLGNDVVEV